MPLALAALSFISDPPQSGGTIYNLPFEQALLLVLGMIFLVALALIYNARTYELPASLAHITRHPHAALHEPLTPSAEKLLTEDDLTLIEGIGPKTRSVFRAAGLTSFAQLAAADPFELDRILDAAGLRLGDPATWPDQARLAAAGDWDGLERLQAELKGGRRAS